MEFIIGAVLLLLVAASIIAWFAAVAWVYRDANRRNLDTAMYWTIGVFFTGYVGFVVYILFQGSSRSAALSGSTE